MADGLLNKASIILTPTGYKAGTLYNVAPVVEPYEDFDFARASVASRVNSSGLVEMVGRTIGSELVTNGDFATDSNWSGTGSNGISISDGKLNFNNTPYTRNSAQSNVTTVGKTYKVVFTVSDYVKGSVRIFLGGSATSTASANGTYVFYLTASSNTTIGVQVMGGSGTTLSVDNVSVKEVIDTNNIPRISYDSNGDNGHILLEPTTTNLYLNTDTLSTQNVSTSASDYSVSFYGTGTITFSGSYSGSLVGTGVNDRVTLTFTATSGTLTSTVSGSVTNAQIENLGYSTSYMPSLSTQGVRATETATSAGSADLINSTEGVLYAEIAALANDGTFRMIGISDGTENNVVNFYYRTDANKITVRLKSGGSQVIFENFDITATNFSKIAFRYKSGESNLFIDGVKQKASDYTTTNMPSGLNEIAFDSGGGSSPFYGKCKALVVFNEALSDAELNNLTG